jgi:CheY-like chemotaxis protein
VPETEPVAGRHETILVVEDDESVRKLTVRMLEHYGYAAIPAVTPAEALALAERDGAIDLVLTDIVMRGGSGTDLARRLRHLRPTVRIVYMSGYASQSVARNGELVEGAGFIQKPFVAPELARKVRETLDAPQPMETGVEPAS